MTDQDIIDGIIHREGSVFTNRPADRGGPTKFGIDLQTLESWRKRPLSVNDVANLTEAEARTIYEHRYIIDPGFSQIANADLRAQVVDYGVTSGPRRAARLLQSVLGLPIDGIVGPHTLEAANKCDPRTTGNKFAVGRAKFYADLVANDAKQLIFLNGWINRALGFVQ